MQAFPILGLELFKRPQPDLEMLADTLAIEFGGHTGELDFTMEGLIRDAEQGAVWHAVAKAVGGDCCRIPCRARLRVTATGVG